MTEPIILDVAIDKVVHAAPAVFDAADPLMSGLVVARDRSYLIARYTHSEGPPNRNGHLFRTADLERQHVLVPGTPLNMMHRTREVVGTFVRSAMIRPKGAKATDRAEPGSYTATPWVKAVAALWNYHFPEETRALRTAFDKGALWVSQESLPASVTCPTCEHNAPWRGYVNDFNCDHMNKPRAPRWMENPHFLGGGAVIPPWAPGWKDAHVETFDVLAGSHPDVAANLMDQLEKAAPHLSDHDRASIAGQLLGSAVDGDVPEIAHLVAPLWDGIVGHYDDIDFHLPADAVAYVSAALRSPACIADAKPSELAWAASVTDGAPRTPAGVRRLNSDLATADPGSAAYLLRGAKPASDWAIATVAAMDAIDAQIAAFLADATKTDNPDARLAAARAGEAMPDGSFHIIRPEDLLVAAKALASARADKRPAIKAHLLERARQLGCDEDIITQLEQIPA